MYSMVKTLRARGRRLRDREISASPGVRGELVLALGAGRPEAKIYEPYDWQRVVPDSRPAECSAGHHDGDRDAFL
jgi:hypothetical protein